MVEAIAAALCEQAPGRIRGRNSDCGLLEGCGSQQAADPTKHRLRGTHERSSPWSRSRLRRDTTDINGLGVLSPADLVPVQDANRDVGHSRVGCPPEGRATESVARTSARFDRVEKLLPFVGSRKCFGGKLVPFPRRRYSGPPVCVEFRKNLCNRSPIIVGNMSVCSREGVHCSLLGGSADNGET